MKYFALSFAVIVFCCCGTASAQYTEPGSGEGGTYTEPGAGGGDGAGAGAYTEPKNPKENNWIATAWGSCSGTALIRTGTSMIKWGLTTTGVLVADDATVVGVVDDPLILISGGTVGAGGVVLVIGGIKILIEAWSN